MFSYGGIVTLLYLISIYRDNAATATSENDKYHLRFSYITTITGGIRAIGAKPVVDLALEEINNRTDILQNYTLGYTTVLNSECTRTGSLNSFFEDFPFTYNEDQNNKSESSFLALLCCGCSPATIPVAEISHYWNIPQIAFAAAANELVDRSRFNSFFRTIPSFEFIGGSIAEVVREFEWKQMAVVTQDETLFTGVNTVLTSIFKQEHWTLDTSSLITSNEEYFTGKEPFPFDIAFNWRNNEDFRVIHINAYAEYAYMVLCKAHELGMLPPRYVWITPMWYNEEWWKPISKKISSFTCSESELLEVLYGSIGVVPDGYFVQENETVPTISGMVASTFNTEYKERLKLPEYDGLEEIAIPGLAYDTVWSIALALNKSIEKIMTQNDSGCVNVTGEIVPLEEFDYTNEMMGCILRESFAELEFQGITGHIMFNSMGSRPDNVLLVGQYRELDDSEGKFEREIVAQIAINSEDQSKNKFEYRNGENAITLWKDGVPYDGSAEEVIHYNSFILAGLYYVLATVGLLCALTCLLFNIVFRKKKVVKLSSPNLNYLIILGAMLLYLCVYLFVSPVKQNWLATLFCNLRFWLFSLGYSLCFGVILSKAWRIYYIFSNPTAKKKNIKDWLLLVIIIIIVLIDMFILLIGTAIPVSRLTGTRVQDGEKFRHVTDAGVNQEYYVYVCFFTRGGSIVWLGISFAYKGLLQIVAMFMAFHTRRIKIKALNDSKETGAIIYINSIVLVLMIVAVFILEQYHHVYAAIFGLALLIQASLFLGLLFIPKAISLYKDPEGNEVFSQKKSSGLPQSHKKENSKDFDSFAQSGSQPTNISLKSPSNNNNSDPFETIKNLRERIRVLESKLQISSENGESVV